MNWNDYEKLILQQIKDAKVVVEHTEKEHRQAVARLNTLETQHKYFKAAIGQMLGGE